MTTIRTVYYKFRWGKRIGKVEGEKIVAFTQRKKFRAELAAKGFTWIAERMA